MLNDSQIKTKVFVHFLKFHDSCFFSTLAYELNRDPAAGVHAVEEIMEDPFLSDLFVGCDPLYFCQLMYNVAKEEQLKQQA